ncbi:MAG: hypothetical protein ACYDCK_05600, partial [Thermoplasmatota archaeon]
MNSSWNVTLTALSDQGLTHFRVLHVLVTAPPLPPPPSGGMTSNSSSNSSAPPPSNSTEPTVPPTPSVPTGPPPAPVKPDFAFAVNNTTFEGPPGGFVWVHLTGIDTGSVPVNVSLEGLGAAQWSIQFEKDPLALTPVATESAWVAIGIPTNSALGETHPVTLIGRAAGTDIVHTIRLTVATVG